MLEFLSLRHLLFYDLNQVFSLFALLLYFLHYCYFHYYFHYYFQGYFQFFLLPFSPLLFSPHYYFLHFLYYQLALGLDFEYYFHYLFPVYFLLILYIYYINLLYLLSISEFGFWLNVSSSINSFSFIISSFLEGKQHF